VNAILRAAGLPIIVPGTAELRAGTSPAVVMDDDTLINGNKSKW
jgi:hypothetical protein